MSAKGRRRRVVVAIGALGALVAGSYAACRRLGDEGVRRAMSDWAAASASASATSSPSVGSRASPLAAPDAAPLAPSEGVDADAASTPTRDPAAAKGKPRAFPPRQRFVEPEAGP